MNCCGGRGVAKALASCPPTGDADQRMELLMATDEDPPFKEWEQLNEKLKQVKAAHRRGKATKDDVRRIEEEYDRAADRIDKTSGS
jgi:hypothetical protein